MNLKGIFRKSFRESKKGYLHLILLHMILIYLMQKKSRHYIFFKIVQLFIQSKHEDGFLLSG